MKKAILSWSGGKDSAMALDRLIKEGYEVVSLLTTTSVDNKKTFGHDEKTEMISAQSKSFNIPVDFLQTTMQDYSVDFVTRLNELKLLYGAEYIAFGDLYIEGHKEWSGRVAQETGLIAIYPIWIKEDAAKNAYFELLKASYKAKIIRVSKDIPGIERFLGQDLNSEFGNFLLDANVCIMGENGEYHTFVYDGEIFQEAIQLEVGDVVETENTHRIKLSLEKDG